MMTLSRIIPEVQSALRSRGPQDPNRSKSKKSKKDPAEGVTLLGQVGCSVIFRNGVSVSPELLIQVIADGVGYSGYLLAQPQDNQGCSSSRFGLRA